MGLFVCKISVLIVNRMIELNLIGILDAAKSFSEMFIDTVKILI